MEHCIEVGVFGLRKKQSLGQVRKGDKIACYVTKEYKIIGFGEATSDYYTDVEPVFRSKDDYFLDRINFKARRLSKASEVDFISLLDKLSFIKKREYWSVYLRNGIAKMTESDWGIITKASESIRGG